MIFRLGRAFHNALDVAELAAYFHHHRTGCAPDGFHRHGGEQERNQAADKQSDDDHMIRQIKRGRDVGPFQAMGKVCEQHERGQTGGADGVTLGHRLGGVANGVERIGDVANFLRQFAHLSDTTGVIGDRAVGVERYDNARHRQHRRRRDGDAIQAGTPIGGPNRRANGKHRPGG